MVEDLVGTQTHQLAEHRPLVPSNPPIHRHLEFQTIAYHSEVVEEGLVVATIMTICLILAAGADAGMVVNHRAGSLPRDDASLGTHANSRMRREAAAVVVVVALARVVVVGIVVVDVVVVVVLGTAGEVEEACLAVVVSSRVGLAEAAPVALLEPHVGNKTLQLYSGCTKCQNKLACSLCRNVSICVYHILGARETNFLKG